MRGPSVPLASAGRVFSPIPFAVTTMIIVMVLAPAAVASATLVVAASIMPGPSSLIAAVVAPAPPMVIITVDVYSARAVRPGGSGASWGGRGAGS